MAQGLEGRLVTQAYPVDDLVELVRAGEIRIPSFQRGLRWTRADVINLFDSIVRGYPIGNLLLWRRSAVASPDMKFGSLTIEAPSLEQALYVVDGQQRLTSLSNALTEEGHKDPRFALAYDVYKDKFVPASGARSSPGEIPLPVIFDLTRLLRWYSEHPELAAEPDLVERSNRVAKSIREFRVPVYVVDQSDPAILRDIFDRMNNYGKQLTRAEVFSALHESGGGDVGQHRGMTDLAAIAAFLHEATGYGLVDENTVLLATLARRGSDISRDIRREFESSQLDFPSETAREAQLATQTALVQAAQFLQTDAGAPHFALLPYRYLLVVLCRFFAHFPSPALASRRNLRRWFWRAATLGPELTRGNITYATRSLCSRIVPKDEAGSVAGLLSMVAERTTPPSVREFRTNYAETRLMLSAMWDAQPRDLDSLEPYDLEALLAAVGEASTAIDQTPQIFRSSTLDASLRALAGNRVFLAEPAGRIPENIVFGLRTIVLGLPQPHRDDFLHSHFISESTALALAEDRVEDFLRARQDDLEFGLRKFLSRQTEWDFEDTPSLASLEILDERDDDLT